MRSLTTSYSEIWQSLEKAADESGSKQLTKVVRDMGGKAAHGFLGLALPERQRQLLLQLPPGAEFHPGSFPRWHGLQIDVFDGDVGDVKAGRFCTFGERGRGPTGVYAALVEDLWSNVSGLTEWDTVLAELRHRLGRWGDFFSEAGPLGLSLPAQRGLFGELWLIGTHLAPNIGVAEAVQVWVGQRNAHQDFQLAVAAIEVKTSIAKQLVDIRIANERQLDDRGLPALFLAVLLLTELENTGESLPQRVLKIRDLAREAGCLHELEEKLLGAGYLDEQSDLYRRGYVLRSFHVYRVTAGFPRLLEEDLPEGIGDVTYSLSLAVAKPFELSKTTGLWWTTS